MKTKFKDLLKSIFLTSVASLISSNEANAISYDLSRISDDNNIEQGKKNDLSQKYILKIHNDNSFLIAGHRSHRSHSSHSSHSSHRSSSYGSYSGSSTTTSSSTSTYNTNTTTSTKTTYSLGERNIISGVSGKDVAELANKLVKIRYIIESDIEKNYSGDVKYSIRLENAIKKFQKDHNQVVDGIVGKKTIEAINKQIELINRKTVNTDVQKYNLGDRILKKQMQGYDVTQLKNILIDKGYLSGKLLKGTSLFDEETEKAVIKFQKSIGIDADGIVETQTVYFLKK